MISWAKKLFKIQAFRVRLDQLQFLKVGRFDLVYTNNLHEHFKSQTKSKLLAEANWYA